MDRAELIKALKPFRAKCRKLGKPIDKLNLYEAYPGDSSSSFVLEVAAEWALDKSTWYAIDFLFDVLFDTVPYEVRTRIFAIKVLREEKCLEREIAEMTLSTESVLGHIH